MKGVARDFMQLRLNRGEARHERWFKGRHRQKKCDNEIDAFRSPRHTMASENSLPPGFQDMLEFGLIEALMGRRARRFFMGAEIPDGSLAYKSRHKPVPLSELEKLLVVTA